MVFNSDNFPENLPSAPEFQKHNLSRGSLKSEISSATSNDLDRTGRGDHAIAASTCLKWGMPTENHLPPSDSSETRHRYHSKGINRSLEFCHPLPQSSPKSRSANCPQSARTRSSGAFDVQFTTLLHRTFQIVLSKLHPALMPIPCPIPGHGWS